MTIKTLAQILEMKDSPQKSSLYELHFLNQELIRYNKKAVILKQSSDYTHHIAVDVIGINEPKPNWYESNSKRYFKNWVECFKYLEGMRDVFYKHILKD